jgi:hypothetical protein
LSDHDYSINAVAWEKVTDVLEIVRLDAVDGKYRDGTCDPIQMALRDVNYLLRSDSERVRDRLCKHPVVTQFGAKIDAFLCNRCNLWVYVLSSETTVVPYAEDGGKANAE